ncbi:hypothetical protein D1007_39364 [Hordeum vulgare]|nr:hypothetical protein D1007_39364 [Hordeum vulgare]
MASPPTWIRTRRRGEQVFLSPPSPYVEEADKGVAKPEKAAVRAHSMGEEVSLFAPSPPRRSRAKRRPPRVWYDEDMLHPKQQFHLMLCFGDVYQFREALVNLHVKQLRRYTYHRNGSDRIIVRCDGEGYQFHMVASKINNEPTFCIKKMIFEHTCPTQSEKTRISSTWLGNKMLETIRSDPNTTIPAIIDKAKRQLGLEVPKMMAWRAKRKAKNIVLGDHNRQYKRLGDYLETVKATNPGSRCIVTSLKYALGGTEEGKFGKYTFMSDRQKGLLNGFTTVFPSCPHRYCLRHIYANFQRAGFRGEDLKKCIDAAAYAYSEHDFQLAMESMKDAWEWMSTISPQAWSGHAMDTNCKTDLVLNNLSEVFNKYILDVRNKPNFTMINEIKDKFLVRCEQKREGGQFARWEIAPTYVEPMDILLVILKLC